MIEALRENIFFHKDSVIQIIKEAKHDWAEVKVRLAKTVTNPLFK